MKIQVLGVGCAKCRELEERTKKALQSAGIEAEVEHVTDPIAIAKMGVLVTPALAINGQVKVAGKVPSEPELVSWLTSAAASE